MATTKFTDQDVYTLAVSNGQFYVTTTVCIEPPTGGRFIEVGDHLLIDPQTQPKLGDLVLSGNRLEPWAGQSRISGVAIQHGHFFR